MNIHYTLRTEELKGKEGMVGVGVGWGWGGSGLRQKIRGDWTERGVYTGMR
jgi:hypothetical protein